MEYDARIISELCQFPGNPLTFEVLCTNELSGLKSR